MVRRFSSQETKGEENAGNYAFFDPPLAWSLDGGLAGAAGRPFFTERPGVLPVLLFVAEEATCSSHARALCATIIFFQIYTQLKQAHACYRLLNISSTIGCSSKLHLFVVLLR